MPNAFAATPRASKLRLTYLFALLTAVLALGGYGYHLYALFQEARAYSPQPQVERLIKDLRAFHTQTRHFPASFVEINERLWHTQPPPDYGANGRTAHARNYEYRYAGERGYVRVLGAAHRPAPSLRGSLFCRSRSTMAARVAG